MTASIGVLLPLRLETRFVEPPAPAGSWTLRVRVVPDAASLDRHQPLATTGELDAVEAMWRATGGDLSRDDAASPWREFAARVGAGRAAWLVRTFPPVQEPGGDIGIERPGETREGLDTGRVVGLPATLELWMGRGGAPPQRAAELSVDASGLSLEFADPGSGEDRWWTSFAEARRVGLGTELDLGPAFPDDIDVLYVIGLGTASPGTVLGAHRDAGVLGIPALGAPTNAVDGEPAAELAPDVDTWRRLVAGELPAPRAEALGLALCGDPSAVLGTPEAETEPPGADTTLVAALWPVLWGHALGDVWGLHEHVHDLGSWARANLAPEGPLPPVRVGDQPYGVLPVTALRRWVPDAGDPPVEARLIPTLGTLRGHWVQAAEKVGTVVGADTEALLEAIGATPSSDGYAWRWLLPLRLLHEWGWAYGSGSPWTMVNRWWEDTARAVLALGATPNRAYATLGYPVDLALPLVQPDNVDHPIGELLNRLLEFPPDQLADERMLDEWFRPWPDSLLFRLLVHAVLISTAEVARAADRDTGPLLDPVVAHDAEPLLAVWNARFDEGQVAGDAVGEQWKATVEAIARLRGEAPTALERALRAVLDTASHRVDPWVTGAAWRRLREQAPTAQFGLGAYGWVDAPRPRGADGPPQEFLHAPSDAQALTAAVLRDRALFDAEPGRWAIDMTSGGIRGAAGLAAEVRLGAHPAEALGRVVEQAVASRGDVDRLRERFPVRDEHAGRRVCDGQALLAAYRSDPGSLGLSAAQLEALAPWSEAHDTYGDLLLADGVHDVVSGRTALAGASMEAAAGLASPPALDVLRTPRGGRTLGTTVVIALPAGEPVSGEPAASPGSLGEPAVAAHLEGIDAPDGPAWVWEVLDAAGDVAGRVTLADLGLGPVDTLSLSPADLADAVLDAGLVDGGVAVDPLVREAGPPAHARARAASDVLGTRPVVPADLTVDGVSPDAAPSDDAVHAELLARYATVHAAGTALAGRLAAAAGAGTEDEQRTALRDALRWGVTPLRADEPPRATRVARAAAAVAERLSRSPNPSDAATQAVETLARALAELVSPEGRLPVLSRMEPVDLPVTFVPEPPLIGDSLDPDWLEVVAAVRPPLARLEAQQLDRALRDAGPFASWSTFPGDPWQLSAGAGDPVPASPRLFAAFGPAGAMNGGAVALGLLDSWAETVPATEHTSTVALHVDAPGAKAPQAILVAVPPDLGTPLDTETLVAIVAETRELAHARAARPADVDLYASGLPLALLPARPAGVDLDRT
ncbi:hypothetical protein ACFPK1_32260 [Actinomycetospora rhizophila]|uniref:Uncharacterized protein n=1 Tax=Actinomycetospora rhizophila TaxID=1416876 RepID=A0ABV9ZRN0_9PSEU